MADPIEDEDELDPQPAPKVPPASFWKREAKILFALLTPLILKAALRAARSAGKDLEQRVGASIDYTLVNEAASKWAKEYTFDLVTGINETTQTYLQDKISKWVETGAPLDDLKKELVESGMFDAQRASKVAVTETTRAYAEGNTTAWRESGVVTGRRWQTAVDEMVCEVCGGLHGQVVGIDEPFDAEIDNPPAHVNCRCFIEPVVEA